MFGFDQFDAARTGRGTIAFAFTDGARLRARVFDPATGLGDTDTLGTAVPEDAVLAAGGDSEGDAVALVNRRGDARLPAEHLRLRRRRARASPP